MKITRQFFANLLFYGTVIFVTGYIVYAASQHEKPTCDHTRPCEFCPHEKC